MALFLCVTIGAWGEPQDDDRYEYVTYTLDVEDTVPVFECTVIDCQDPVDLGLPSGLKWATCNIGATSPEDYGAYFAWGETIDYLKGDRNHSFDQFNYKFYSSSLQYILLGGMTKYNANDGLTQLEPEDDAAHINWQGDWRMPTAGEWTELITTCHVNRTRVYGKDVLVFTGPNGNSITLPLAGFREGTSWSLTGFVQELVGTLGDLMFPMGSYWSSTLSSNQKARYLYYLGLPSIHIWPLINIDPILEMRTENRWLGRPIRAVCEECEKEE